MSAVKMKWAIEPRLYYDNIFGFSEGFSAVKRSKKYGFINEYGAEITPVTFSDVYYFKNGLAPVCGGFSGWEYINPNMQTVISAIDFCLDREDREVSPFSDGLAAVKIKEGSRMYKLLRDLRAEAAKWVYIDTSQKICCTIDNDSADTFVNGLALLVKTPSWYAVPSHEIGYNVINKEGKKLLNTSRYKKVLKPRNGPIAVFDGSRWGFIERGEMDSSGIIHKFGEEIIPCMYENLITFENGLAAAKKNGKWGYINKDNQTVIPFIYSNVGSFHNGFAIAERNILGKTKKIILDMAGHEIKLADYDYTEHIESDVILVRDRNGKFGYIDKLGNEIFKPEFDDALPVMDGKAPAKKHGLWGILKVVK